MEEVSRFRNRFGTKMLTANDILWVIDLDNTDTRCRQGSIRIFALL